jgi:hypothetical protein
LQYHLRKKFGFGGWIEPDEVLVLAQRGKRFEDQVQEVRGFELVVSVGGVLLDSQLLWYLSEATAEAIFDSVEQP